MKYSVSIFLLLSSFYSFAQELKYGLPKVNSTCERGADSIIRNNISMPYENIGITKEIKWYDAQNKPASLSRYYNGGLDFRYTIFRERLSNGFRDSSYTDVGPGAPNAGVSFYGSDSLCTRSLSYYSTSNGTAPRLSRETQYSYEIGADVQVQNQRYWNINASGQKDSGLSYRRVKYKGGKLFSDSSWSLRSRAYYTYQGDTIITYQWDSVGTTYSRVSVDSSVTITSWYGDKKIITRFSSYGFVDEMEGSDYKEYRSIDTIVANKSTVTWAYNELTGRFEPLRKGTSTVKGNSVVSKGYRWVNQQWEYYTRTERLYMDDNRKCIGQEFNYTLKNGNWELASHATYYYKGVTAALETEETPECNLPNPFLVSYPFSCSALHFDEEYTLSVFDLSGKKIIEKQFFADQSIGELVMLNSGNLYYFVITDDSDEVISRQKILMGN